MDADYNDFYVIRLNIGTWLENCFDSILDNTSISVILYTCISYRFIQNFIFNVQWLGWIIPRCWSYLVHIDSEFDCDYHWGGKFLFSFIFLVLRKRSIILWHIGYYCYSIYFGYIHCFLLKKYHLIYCNSQHSTKGTEIIINQTKNKSHIDSEWPSK